MRTVSAQEATQSLASLLEAAQREPVVITRPDQQAAVLISMADFDRLRRIHADDFRQARDDLAAAARARGLTDAVAAELLDGIS